MGVTTSKMGRVQHAQKHEKAHLHGFLIVMNFCISSGWILSKAEMNAVGNVMLVMLYMDIRGLILV